MDQHQDKSPAFATRALAKQVRVARALEGTVIDGKYQVFEKIGEGGMGSVYRAEHTSLSRSIALKVLHPNLAQNEESKKRFIHESNVTSKLSHPSAVTIYDFGFSGEMPYIAMEFVEGKTLKQIIKKEGALSLKRAYLIFKQIAGALEEAHRLNIIHRDLKPENIMVSPTKDGRDQVFVLDFGIAKIVKQNEDKTLTDLTKAGMFLGTPEYMAPETVRNELDQRSDIYSLGIVLYEMLSGSVPFHAPSAMGIMMAHLQDAPQTVRSRNPWVFTPRRVDRVIMKALAKDPKDRHQNVAEMMKALRKAVRCSARLRNSVSSVRMLLNALLTRKMEILNYLEAKRTKTVHASDSQRAVLGAVLSKQALGVFGGILAVILVLGSGGYLAQQVLFGSPSGELQKQASVPISSLRVYSKPAGATVVFDGVVYGKSPILLKNVPGGKHQLELRKKGFTANRLDIALESGATSDYDIHLEREAVGAFDSLVIAAKAKK